MGDEGRHGPGGQRPEDADAAAFLEPSRAALHQRRDTEAREDREELDQELEGIHGGTALPG